MSYAQVTAHNAAPLSQQPHPDPALLNTDPPTSSPYIDPTKKINVVPMNSNPNSHRPRSRRYEEAKAEGDYLWESAKHYLFRPGVAGGLIGLVNIGLLAGAARAFYVNPHYRRNTQVISATAAATLALLGVEGYAADAYRKTAAGQEEERRAKEEGAAIYRYLREQILRPGTLGGLLGLINLGILGSLGYWSYENWDRQWDRRMVSAVSAGLFTLSLGEGYVLSLFMSDIRLNTLKYTPLANQDADEDDDEPTPKTMRASVRAAAAATSSRLMKKPGRRQDRYTDDPEEEAGLLGDRAAFEEEEQAYEAEEHRLEAEAVQPPPRRGLLKGRHKSPKDTSRTIPFRPPDKFQARFPPNIVRNQKYNVFTFLPLVFYEQFKFFFNLYFLLVALSQFIPALKIGFIVTYIAPLAFVLCVTMGKEAYDDYKRNLRDREANSAKYLVLDPPPGDPSSSALEGSAYTLAHANTRAAPSSSLRVGDLIRLEKNQRVPADMVLLHTSEASGTCFIRTDQLDGETDWKLRVAVPETQKLDEGQLTVLDAEIYADAPMKDIHTFVGTFTLNSPAQAQATQSMESVPMNHIPSVAPLTAENVLWANTVLAAGSAVGLVVYTGSETRAVMNTSHPETKVGLLDLEINNLAKILCLVTFALSVVLVALNGFRGPAYIYIVRFLILFSSIIPISLRVNLDMGKTVYAQQIMTDPEIPETIVRTSTLPEELGRIEYLLSDKTGTLTQNEMEMRKLHMGTMSYGFDSMDEVAHQLAVAFGAEKTHRKTGSLATGAQLATRGRRDMSSRVRDVVLSLALCHNVTPVTNDDGSVTYQASSPDEVAIVTWTQSIGLTLVFRDRARIELQTPSGERIAFDVLELFPFTSESKRMGIVVRDAHSGEITFLQKGADVVMAKIVQRNDWLEEETANMAREGLRTLVMARRRLSAQAYAEFKERYHAASIKLEGRNEAMAQVIAECLEHDLELLGLTGVEDKLQDEVKSTLELLRNAGIKIWMLTGDKIETARCIAISTKLVARNQYIHEVAKLKTSDEVRNELEFLQSKLDCCLVIDGESLQLCLDLFKNEFIEIATKLSAVVACRCSPTQKADVARLIPETHTKTHVGVGIVGKEGKQASLAADFSVTQFSFLTKLLLWHGRNSYRRSAKLAQFVIHRGLIISVMQAVFSAIFFFAPIALYQGWLMVGYATVYTMAPVFSLVLDRDVSEDLAILYPELYKETTKGRALSYKTFFQWLMISVYQGGAIMIMSLVLFETEFLHIVSISFTALILNELIMVALEITTWHTYMVISEIVTLFFYVISIAFLPEYFDLTFVVTVGFGWKVVVIVALSALPLYIIKLIRSRVAPAASSKLL
ncbi:Phospholipid-transporting ATPase [Mycena sanguinolenta]|uniref:Phospholipid-transporting ATPase n=1 Tax=Mycena sanguinolenta TaxID=230812 RepID=A0A8H7DJW0_9AGAR|nr:Phospholipid-transporting ATPase [Mycena sanguinolenta]